jgi:sugar lactone lactonase YvrE
VNRRTSGSGAVPIVAVLWLVVASVAQAAPESSKAVVFVHGAHISGANGMHFSKDGLLYVASVLGSELVVLNPDTGAVVRRLTRADGVEGPDDVAFDSAGAFYWTSILTGEVAGFRTDGTRVTAAKLSPGVNPLTFSDDGRLFVAQCFFGDKLHEVDPNGVAEPRLITDRLGPKCGLNGMDWGADRRLYGPRWFRHEVVSVDVATGTFRTEASGFGVPAAVKFDSKGRLHVLDTMAGTVIRVADGKREVVATLSPGLDNFAFDESDRLFVSSFTDGFVVRVEPDGSLFELSPGGMATPGGVTVSSNGGRDEIVVADLQALRGFDRASGAVAFTERNILGVSEVGSALTVAAAGDGLVLSSWIDEDVRIWDPVARRIVERHGDLGAPTDAIAFDGGLAVSEHANHRVIAIRDGQVRVLAAGLGEPTGLAAHGRDLYVADRARGELLRIVSSGRVMSPPQVVARGLEAPEGIARVADGFAVVEAERGRVVLVSEDGRINWLADTEPGTAAASSAQPPSFVFNGIAAAADGTLYVTGERSRVVYRIKR